jgi:17beta-estradiol 17-dehydrogenase / 3beta-hydroxysteroid 3-dehydrogenase
MDLTRWRGRVAMVTGASSGIGRAVAERLAAAHMRVVICGRRRARLHELAERLGARGADVLPVAVDLRREGDIAALWGRVRSEWGGVDVLVNNAGLGRHAPLLDGATGAWREMLEVNVLALCVCTREALHDMRRRGDGHVVHVSSMAAHRVPLSSGVYSASKHAVRALTEGLRAELRALGSGIRVSAVSPGLVETEFASHYHGSDEKAQQAYSRYKVLEPSDVAEAVAYLLSQPKHVQVHDLLLRPTEQPN